MTVLSALLALLALVVTTAVAFGTRRQADLATATAALGAWLLLNKPLGGTVVVVVDDFHGVTLADVAGVGLWLLAAASVLWRPSRGPR